jgi:UDP-glucose 6-dehydrogenase
LATVTLSRNLEEVMAASDAAVVCTEWPEIREADWDKVLAKAKEIVVIDANGFLANIVSNRQELTCRRVGKPRNANK